MPAFTIAVSTFRENYFNWVIELLDSLKIQTFKDFIVLLVVNSNNAYYNRLCSAIKKKNYSFKVKILFNPVDYGIAFARNIALKNSDTPFIAFTDDDVIPDVNWLKVMCNTFINMKKLRLKVGALTGPIVPNWTCFDESTSADWFPKELYWVIGCTTHNFPAIQLVRNGFASNLILDRRKAFCCGGFNESFGYNQSYRMAGEEPELCLKLKRKEIFTIWNPALIVNHRITPDRINLRSIILRSYIEGRSKAYLNRLLGHDAMAVEANHILSVITGIIKGRSIKSKIYLILSTFAVALGYILTLINIRFKLKTTG